MCCSALSETYSVKLPVLPPTVLHSQVLQHEHRDARICLFVHINWGFILLCLKTQMEISEQLQREKSDDYSPYSVSINFPVVLWHK